jgi:hypothetical protein
MANKIQIKRSTANPTVSGLANGELAFTQASNTLWIGLPDGSGALSIGGARVPGVLTANQALVANATSGIDKVIVANLVPTSMWANGSSGVPGQLLASNGAGGLYWAEVSATGVTNIATANGVGGGPIVSTGTLYVIANNGIVANSTGVWAAGANGITIAPTGINVRAGNSQIVSNTTGVWVIQSQIDHDSLSGFVGNEHIDHSTVSISPGSGLAGGGDLTATRTLNVNANNGLVANAFGVFVIANSGLVSNTTGVHVLPNNGIIANSTGIFAKPGTGVTVDGTGISIGQAVGTGSFVTFANVVTTDMTVSGNLVVSGTTTTLSTQNLLVNDNMIGLADAQNDTASFLDAVDSGFYVSTGNTLNSFYSGIARIAGSSSNTNPTFRVFATGTLPNSTVLTGLSTGTIQAFLTPWGPGGAFVVNSTAMALTANNTVSLSLAANSISLSTALPTTSGGTGLNTYTSGDILVGNTGNALSKLSIGADGTVLQVSGTSVVFQTLDGGTF